MQSGKLDQRVTIERFVQGVDEIGQPIEEWTVLAAVWGAVEPLNGREYFSADAAQSEVTTRVRIRYRTDLTTADRIDHEGTSHDIISIINPRSGDEELVLMCRAAATS